MRGDSIPLQLMTPAQREAYARRMDKLAAKARNQMSKYYRMAADLARRWEELTQ